MRRGLMTVVAVAVLAGCGQGSSAGGEEARVDDPYDGPMSLPQSFADKATPLERSGAAGQALECEGRVFRGGAGNYDSGPESVQPGPEEALDDWIEQEAWALQIPETGYAIERDDGDRVLFSYDVDGHSTIAVITADGITDYDGDDWWGVESWAMCDPSELPAAVTDELNWGVWEDASGRRVPVTRIVSYRGSEHCDWQDLTFLYTGSERHGPQYVRDVHGELAEWLTTTYDADATMPVTASDTGLRRDGHQLWLDDSPKAAYVVSIDDPTDVERWPAAAKDPIGCA